MTTSAYSPSVLVPALRAAENRASARRRLALLVALLLSLVLHLCMTLWPTDAPIAPEATPLTATITELPPPPKPSTAAAPAPKPKPKRASPIAKPLPVPVETPADATTTDDIAAGDKGLDAGGQAAEPAPVTSAEAQVIPGAVTSGKTLPPRVDLTYKVFYGTGGFLIGEAVYRFEHTGSRYRIRTIGQARGLAALILRGQGKIESRGIITEEGLQPLTFRVERGPDRVETATFDWEAGVVTLNDNRTAVLDIPTFDPLALMWQYYFTPPTGGTTSFTVATPRRVYRYTMAREGTEEIEWAHGTIHAERWHRRSNDGKTDAYVWLAESLRFIPVKMRVTNTDRGTIEAVLDAIRIDETAMPNDNSELQFDRSSDSNRDAARNELFPGENSGPAPTFPAITGQ